MEANEKCGHSYGLGSFEELASVMDGILDENLSDMGESSYSVVMFNFKVAGMSKRYQSLYLKLMRKD